MEGKIIPTTIFLTFEYQTMLEHVTVLYRGNKVKPLYPNVMQ
jgi:hypothetical protein